MENEKNTPQPEDNGWLDQWLTENTAQEELGPDESAISGAGLSDISDMEIEKIIQETAADDWLDLNTEPEPEMVINIAEEPAPEASQEEAPAAEEPGDEEEAEEGPVRKVRPRWRSGYGLFGIPHLLSVVLLLAMILFMGESLGRLAWICAADVLAFGREDKVVTVTIDENDDLETVAEKLYNAGLIKYKKLFTIYGDITDMEEDGQIVPGTYELNTLFDYHALANGIAGESAVQTEVEVMIPEGYTCAQIFALLEEKGVCSARSLDKYAAEGELENYWFLDGVERGL